MTRCNNFGPIALILAGVIATAGCSVAGSAAPDPAGLVALFASSASSAVGPNSTGGSHSTGSSTATPADPPASSTARMSPGPSDDESVPASDVPDSLVAPTSGVASTEPSTSSRAAGSTASGSVLRLDSDDFASSRLVAQVWADVLQSRGIDVAVSVVPAQADELTDLKAGRADLALLFNGALLDNYDPSVGAQTRSEVDAALTRTVPAGFTVLKSSGAQDGEVFAVSAATAKKFSLRSLPDLAAHSSAIQLAAPDDTAFSNKLTQALESYYGVRLTRTVVTDFGGPKVIAAITSTTPTVGLMASSEYQIDDDDMVVLTDPGYLFAPENFIPMINRSRVGASAQSALNAVAAKMTTKAVRDMRRKLEEGTASFDEAAEQWIATSGLG